MSAEHWPASGSFLWLVIKAEKTQRWLIQGETCRYLSHRREESQKSSDLLKQPVMHFGCDDCDFLF